MENILKSRSAYTLCVSMMLFVDRIGSWKINMKKSAVTYPKISIFLFYTCNFSANRKWAKYKIQMINNTGKDTLSKGK